MPVQIEDFAMTRRIRSLLWSLLVSIALTACGGGGGGGGGDPPPAPENNKPVINLAATIETPENELTVLTIDASDADGDGLSFSIAGGDDADLFTLDSSAGQLTFKIAPDYESPEDSNADNAYELEIGVSDGKDSVAQTITVTITNVNDNNPVITSSGTTPSVNENTTAVTTITATDDDGTTPTYKIVGGADSGLFSIDADSGTLSFTTAPNYEALTKNPLEVQVAATDGALDSAAQMIVVTVHNVNETPPVFTSGDFIVAENTLKAGTVIANDPDGVSPTYIISGGFDQALFNLNEVSGELRFKNNPDYETPVDNGADNIYDLMITASSEGDNVELAITVTVTNVNDLPEFISATTVSVAENSISGTVFHTVVATDQDIGSSVSYSISGGVDSGAFAIDATTGQLSLAIVPDFEAPVSHSGNNDYVVVVSATDNAAATVFQTITVSVSNVFDPPAAVTLSVSASAKQLVFSWTELGGTSFARLKKDPDGSSGFTQVGTDIPAGTGKAADNIAVHQLDWPNVRYLLEVCNLSDECSASAQVYAASYMLDAIGYVKSSDTKSSPPFYQSNDEFGWSVAISDDGATLAVGSRNNGSNVGAVYIYSKDADGGWGYDTKLVGANTEAPEKFGHSVALSYDGNTLAVGAIGDAGAASGAVYVFSGSGVDWSQQAYLKASNADVGDQFGQAVSLSNDGNTLAVGAHQEDSNATGVATEANGDNSLGQSGAVYVFTRSGTTWTHHSYIKASTPGEEDLFGASLSLAGDGATLAVGAYHVDSSANTIGGDEETAGASINDDYGAVYIFSWDGSAWSQQQYIKPANAGKGDHFGMSVSLSDNGNILAVGADEEDGGPDGIDDCETNSQECISDSGAAYLFTRTDITWIQTAYLKASNAELGDLFGTVVSLSGDGSLLAVGAIFEDSNATGRYGDNTNNTASQAGAVFTFTDIAGIWTEQAYLKASNTDPGDTFGRAVSINGDGTTLAISAEGEDSKAINIGGNQVHDCDTTNDNCAKRSGAVYLY